MEELARGVGRADGRHARHDEGRRDEDGPARLVHRQRVPARRVPRAVPATSSARCATSAPPMPWERVRKVLDEEYDEPCEDLFEEIEPEAFAAASIGQVHRAVLPDGRRVAVKVQYPGIDTALRADLSNAGMLLRLAKAIAPGPRRARGRRRAARAGARGARLRVRGAEPALVRARLPRPPVHLRARRGHAPVAQPRAGHRVRRGRRLRGGEGARAGGARPLRRDRLPLLPRLDLPAAALQRRRPPGQLPADGRRAGRVPRLRHDQAARHRADPARGGGRQGAPRRRRRAPAPEAARARLPAQPEAGSTPSG